MMPHVLEQPLAIYWIDTSYHLGNTEKLKLFTLFWSILDWLTEKLLQQRMLFLDGNIT
jgi:hypothetical protein